MKDMAGKRVTVMGLGRFGGGSGVARWLAEQGARVHVTDLYEHDALADPLDALRDLIDEGQITLRLGEHHERDFAESEMIIANPAVPKPWANRYLNVASRASVPITTEMRLVLERIDRRRVIGITGTAGKSTTAAMIHHILTHAGLGAYLGGNIGGSLLNAIASAGPGDWYVIELSSFMLHWLGEGVGYASAPGISPHIAAMTNIEPNHLDWHGTFEHYEASKNNIFRYQDRGDHAIDGRELPAVEEEISLQVPGRHHQRNAQVALRAAACVIGVHADELAPHVSTFTGLPHRLQFVAEHDGIRYFNDSKSTTPGATRLAVEAFDDPARVHLIAGGYDKGSDLTPIVVLGARLAGLYTIGTTGKAMARAAGSDQAIDCETLDRAVAVAQNRLRPGDVLLLSPGCASWDQFTSYEQRGEQFSRLVSTLAQDEMMSE